MIWQMLCFGNFTLVMSLSFLITFYPCEHSLGPIMEILLLSYACSPSVSNKLHDIPSWKHCNWIIKEGYFVLMHLIIMLSWWNPLFMMTFFPYYYSFIYYFLLYPKYLQFKCGLSVSLIYLVPPGSQRVCHDQQGTCSSMTLGTWCTYEMFLKVSLGFPRSYSKSIDVYLIASMHSADWKIKETLVHFETIP